VEVVKDERSETQVDSHVSGDLEIVSRLKEAIAGGRQWYLALLEAISVWSKPEEHHEGRDYKYLVAGEAFDWLLLAERLCLEVDGLIPEAEKRALLFHGKPPIELTPEEFRALIGEPKHRGYLNYVYGVIVEEVLVLAVEDEVRKERQSLFSNSDDDVRREAYLRLYGSDMDSLIGAYRDERHSHQREEITLAEMKEFTYWLFQLRLRQRDKARVASDTKKALSYLQQQRTRGLLRWDSLEDQPE
jgi:hypothetical protein